MVREGEGQSGLNANTIPVNATSKEVPSISSRLCFQIICKDDESYQIDIQLERQKPCRTKSSMLTQDTQHLYV